MAMGVYQHGSLQKPAKGLQQPLQKAHHGSALPVDFSRNSAGAGQVGAKQRSDLTTKQSAMDNGIYLKIAMKAALIKICRADDSP